MSDDSIWIQIPSILQHRIIQWRSLLEAAVPVLKSEDDLSIKVLSGLSRFPHDLKAIVSEASRTTPLQAMLTHLKIVRLNEQQSAIVIGVDCPELKELHGRLTGRVTCPIDLTQSAWEPVIQLATFENAYATELGGITELEAMGIAGEKFIIDGLIAGMPHSNLECAFLGHAPLIMSGYCESDRGEGGEPLALKAAGMSTLTGESGGYLTQAVIDIPEDETEEPDDEDDDGWMSRAMGLTEFLDGGEY